MRHRTQLAANGDGRWAASRDDAVDTPGTVVSLMVGSLSAVSSYYFKMPLSFPLI